MNNADVHVGHEDGDIKVWFRFAPREGWLSYDTEGLWAERQGDNLARIKNRSAEAVHAKLGAFRLGGEIFSSGLPLLAFGVPSDADFAGIKAVLERGRSEGWWHFEVGSATDP
jgi:hypothetical protein